jgi:hypothetical protein
MRRLRSSGFHGSIGCGLLHVVFHDQYFYRSLTYVQVNGLINLEAQ